ncbi:ImmA/IrrE family metallo-endopeptidase [Umezawaea sp. NPDC059074]|uniref:ImmA/IrrE family metallo-endopeptidase n=1 Tax=Umezawaea sp. NPDC059074 TaxID=3346716 RepID=UPI00368D8199
MTGEFMADRRARRLEPDWERTNDDIRDGLTALNDQNGLAELAAALGEYGQTEWGQKSVSPFEGFLGNLTEELIAALADGGADPARLDTVRVVGTMREEMSAEMVPFADGSGLVVVSGTILSLCMMYSRSVGVAMDKLASGGRLRRMWGAFTAARMGAAGVDVPVLASVLRYYNVNQRVYGLAANLGLRIPEEAGVTATRVFLQSARFVVGHELAHHVLGHDSAPSGFFPGEHLPVCSDDQRRELAADLMAHFVVTRMNEVEFEGTEAAKPAALLALLGGLVAMVAVHSAEQALFVRRGVSHPPASQRAALLLDQVDRSMRGFAGMFLPSLLAATEASSVFAEGADLFDGDEALASPMIYSPLPMSSVRTVGKLDKLQCQPIGRSVEYLVHLDPAIPSIGEGARLAARGDAAGALRAWSVPEETVVRFVDPRQALTFHAVVSAVCDGLEALGLAEASRLTSALIAARLVEPALAA